LSPGWQTQESRTTGETKAIIMHGKNVKAVTKVLGKARENDSEK
jgi:hypothetical protein